MHTTVCTFTSPSVLPAQNPKGSKYPNGASAPGRNSALIDSFVADLRDIIDAGLKAMAEASTTEAITRDLNIIDVGSVDKIVMTPQIANNNHAFGATFFIPPFFSVEFE